ncbi:hypothetical protein [Hymenobacter cellulosivorans]|uniref:XRE family transcriptional regulator n=1 Tax=Hymenobacter cellulosivorans TaxID=2932249 RepID=A0ABY4F5K8_9BACT|nr:hypothetical protein [Hymenobacter cellulosivorans]UOQ51808.1 hypothetical protein MUN80_18845 [Hymenobacter cellulosivorans]
MARPATDSWLAHLCAHFGLRAYQLAQYLGVDSGQLSRLSNGQRPTGPAVQEALAPFLACLQAAEAEPPPLAVAAPAAAPLEARLDYCRHHARRLRRQLRPLEAQAQAAAHWAQALPTLRAALPPDPGPGAEPDGATDWPSWHTWFRHRWLTRHSGALSPELSARYHLLRLQAKALETEAAALQALLQRG